MVAAKPNLHVFDRFENAPVSSLLGYSVVFWKALIGSSSSDFRQYSAPETTPCFSCVILQTRQALPDHESEDSQFMVPDPASDGLRF